MNLQEIREERDKNNIQLTPEQLKAITKTLGRGCNFLVFGVGNDSPFWLKANKGGKTIFIENDKEWANKVKSMCPGIKIIPINYDTKLSDWEKLINHPESLSLELGPEIRNTNWDVILVDAPPGYAQDKPGRMKSIYQASILIKDRGHVFVHDCDRPVEQAYSDKYLLDANLIKEITILRHYFIGKKNTFLHKIKVCYLKMFY